MRYVLLMGSNQDPEARLHQARAALERAFGILRVAPELWSPDRDAAADVLSGAGYLNQGVEIASPHDVLTLKQQLREIEYVCGRQRPALRSGACEIDIDIALAYVKTDRSAQAQWLWQDEKARQQPYARAALQSWLDESCMPRQTR